MKQFITLAIAVLVASAAHSANWVEISSHADGGIRQYLDPDSMERHLGSVELLRVIDYQPGHQRKAGNQPYASQLVRTEFDCPSRAVRQISVAAHAGQMAMGALVQEVKEPSLWEIDSFDEFIVPLWTIACPGFEP